MNYIPQEAVNFTSLEEAVAFLIEENRRIAAALNARLEGILPEIHAEPTKLISGMVAFADGTDWDPGSGQGVYCYYNSAWNKLG